MIRGENAPGVGGGRGLPRGSEGGGGATPGAPRTLGRPRAKRSIPGPDPPPPQARCRAGTHPRRRGARGAPPP